MFHYPALITALSMLLFAVVTRMVGVARGRYKVAVPATSGHPDFERYYRVQQNTLEQLMLFLPSLWLFAAYVSPEWAGALGAVWLVGRVLFARGYYRETKKRVPGFIIGIATTSILLLGGLIGILMQLAA
jgi:glutathione S-transferase